MAEALDPQLLDVIVCPQCRGALALVGEELQCAACRVSYPIRSGIPVLLGQYASPIQ